MNRQQIHELPWPVRWESPLLLGHGLLWLAIGIIGAIYEAGLHERENMAPFFYIVLLAVPGAVFVLAAVSVRHGVRWIASVASIIAALQWLLMLIVAVQILIRAVAVLHVAMLAIAAASLLPVVSFGLMLYCMNRAAHFQKTNTQTRGFEPVFSRTVSPTAPALGDRASTAAPECGDHHAPPSSG